jgi:hypothetical protein
MGYLKEFREKLTEKLEALDEKSRQEVANFVADAVLESYRNGQKSRAEKSREVSAQPVAKRPEGRWQKRGA